jgi:alpha,alpha-trehalase
LVAKAKAGELNLDRTLWAMRRAAEPQPHPNRYWDERGAPRDESFKEDVRTALQSRRPDAEVWRNLRAAAESGWDFSSRWLADGRTLNTIQTLDLLPPDLNGALVHLEQTPVQGAYRLKRDLRRAAVYTERARQRISAIHHLMWHSMGSVGSTMIAGLFLGTSAGLNDGRVLR